MCCGQERPRPREGPRAGGALARHLLGGTGGELRLPGAAGLEAEFPEKVPRVKGVWVNERFWSALVLALIAAGYAAERRRGASD